MEVVEPATYNESNLPVTEPAYAHKPPTTTTTTTKKLCSRWTKSTIWSSALSKISMQRSQLQPSHLLWKRLGKRASSESKHFTSATRRSPHPFTIGRPGNSLEKLHQFANITRVGSCAMPANEFPNQVTRCFPT